MCLVALALGQHPHWPLLLAANRDEFFARPAAPLAHWAVPEAAGIVAGRDLREGGTWLGLNAHGRLAVLTNVREPQHERPRARSRGEWVSRWLSGQDSVDDLLQATSPQDHGGFNLLLLQWLPQLAAPPRLAPLAPLASGSPSTGGVWQAHAVSNRLAPGVPGWAVQALGPGVYGLSNGSLDSPWPKTLKLRERMVASLASLPPPRQHEPHLEADGQDRAQPHLHQDLFLALQAREPAPEEHLPDTGLPLSAERALSSAFIDWPDHPSGPYGTRCSTVVSARQTPYGIALLAEERTHGPAGSPHRGQLSRASLAWRGLGFHAG